MNITASDVQDSTLTATVTIPAADVDAAIKKAYKDAASKYRFQGFRKGRAPRPVIDAMLGSDFVLGQATNELLEKNEPLVLNELDIVPVKNGDVKDIQIVKDGEDYTFQMEYKLRPSAELSSYDPVAIEMPPAEATEAEIDAQVDMLMGYHTTFDEVEDDRGIENGDIVNADIENVKNAEALANKGRMISVGSGNLPAPVDEALVGMKKGETKEIAWTPEAPEGQEAEEAAVKVTITSIRTRNVPELTDEFAKESFGFDDVAAMRDAIKIEVEADKKGKLPQLKENRAVAELATRLELEEVDEDYAQSVFQELGQNFLSNLAAQGMTLDGWLQASGLSSQQFIADLHRQADDVARESLALDALARHLEVEVTEEDVDKEFADAGVKDIEASKKQFEAEGRIPAVRDSIKRGKAIEWLVDNAQVTEVDEYAKRAEESQAE